MNGPSDLTKAEIERKLVQMGATFVQNPGRSLFQCPEVIILVWRNLQHKSRTNSLLY